MTIGTQKPTLGARRAVSRGIVIARARLSRSEISEIAAVRVRPRSSRRERLSPALTRERESKRDRKREEYSRGPSILSWELDGPRVQKRRNARTTNRHHRQCCRREGSTRRLEIVSLGFLSPPDDDDNSDDDDDGAARITRKEADCERAFLPRAGRQAACYSSRLVGARLTHIRAHADTLAAEVKHMCRGRVVSTAANCYPSSTVCTLCSLRGTRALAHTRPVPAAVTRDDVRRARRPR